MREDEIRHLGRHGEGQRAIARVAFDVNAVVLRELVAEAIERQAVLA